MSEEVKESPVYEILRANGNNHPLFNFVDLSDDVETVLKLLREFVANPDPEWVKEVPTAFYFIGDMLLRSWKTQEALEAFRQAVAAVEKEPVTEEDIGYHSARVCSSSFDFDGDSEHQSCC